MSIAERKHEVLLRYMLSMKAVQQVTGLSKTELQRLCDGGDFPQPEATGGGPLWLASEVTAWKAMTPKQYRAAIRLLKLSPLRAGYWLGVSEREAAGYNTGRVRVPHPVSMLLRLMIEKELNPKDVK